MTGNPINVRRGRIVLSDLDQIKKNERDRRRRLRLEQVRVFVENFQTARMKGIRNIELLISFNLNLYKQIKLSIFCM